MKKPITRSKAGGGGFGGIKPSSRSKRFNASDVVDLLELDTEFLEMRMVGAPFGVATHWIDILTAKGVIQIGKNPLNYDPETDSFDSTIKDPYAEIPNPKRTAKAYYVNAIIRDLQEQEPRKKPKPSLAERKSGFKEKGSPSWTPVRVVRIPSSVAEKLQKLATMNKHKIDGRLVPCDITDEKYGMSVFLSYDKDAPGTDKYQVQKGDKCKLTEEEKGYLVYDLSKLWQPEDLETAKREAEALAAKLPEDENLDEEDDEEEEEDGMSSRRKKPRGKSGKKPAGKVKRRSLGDDDDDDDEEEEEDTPKRPVRSKKVGTSSTKKKTGTAKSKATSKTRSSRRDR